MRPTTRTLVTLAILSLGACKPFEIPGTVEVPPGSVQFVFDPAALFYDFYDSIPPNAVQLRYLPSQGYGGSNCLALSPNNGTDTVGSFVFATYGQNLGRVARLDHGVLDTTAFVFLSGQEGTRGSYVIHSNGALKLTWSDWGSGNPSRYFVDTANVRIIGDSIASDVVNAQAGSRAIWSVRWVRGICGS